MKKAVFWGVFTGKRKGYSLLHLLPIDYMREMHKHEHFFFFLVLVM